MKWENYPVELKDIKPGIFFEMLNYTGLFMRVEAWGAVKVINKYTFNQVPREFNDDGFHVPIVNISNGKIFWMAKNKPCKVFKGTWTYSDIVEHKYCEFGD